MGGVIIGVILLFISPALSNLISTTFDDTALDSDISNKTSLNNINSDNDISDTTILNEITPNNATTNNTIPDNITTNSNTDDITPPIFDDPYNISSNGTMPKGTAPIDFPITEEMEEILVAISKISIGSSKNWIDDKLGPPYASNIVAITEDSRVWPHTDESSIIGEVLECVYMFDVVSVMIYFDTPENSCIAFFVTLMEDVSNVDIVMPEAYSFFVSNKPLGEFAFADIDYEPYNVYGYVSNGVGRVFYGEQYYFMGGGNYQDFCFAILDYGMLNSLLDFDRFLTEIEWDITTDPGNGASVLASSDILTQQRGRLYPNTYGISVLNEELTFSLFSVYMGFDSAAFRMRG